MKLVKRPNHHLVEEPSPIKPGPTDYELYITPKPVNAHLKQLQVGAIIGLASVVYSEVYQGQQAASYIAASSLFPAFNSSIHVYSQRIQPHPSTHARCLAAPPIRCCPVRSWFWQPPGCWCGGRRCPGPVEGCYQQACHWLHHSGLTRAFQLSCLWTPRCGSCSMQRQELHACCLSDRSP